MRNIFRNLVASTTSAPTTTPSPECKKAQAAYKAYCEGTLNNNRLKRCEKQKEWNKANPYKAQNKHFKEAVAELAKQEKIINDPNSTKKQIAEAEAAKGKIKGVKILEELAAMEAKSKELRQEAERLAAAVRKLDNCPLPECEGSNPDCPDGPPMPPMPTPPPTPRPTTRMPMPTMMPMPTTMPMPTPMPMPTMMPMPPMPMPTPMPMPPMPMPTMMPMPPMPMPTPMPMPPMPMPTMMPMPDMMPMKIARANKWSS